MLLGLRACVTWRYLCLNILLEYFLVAVCIWCILHHQSQMKCAILAKPMSCALHVHCLPSDALVQIAQNLN